MRELALHILDIVENGITAGADCIHIVVEEARREDHLKIVVRDNGPGMPAEKTHKLDDPFVTTRTTRRVGLGLSLLAAAAQRCEGRLAVATEPGQGTEVTATFRYSHIDRAPVGDMAATVATLMMGNPDTDFVYTHIINGNEFSLDTREIREELGEASLSDAMVIHHLTQSMREALHRLSANG
ncbi:MAG: ATP-binding protein [Desulfobacterales bacterium]|nr:MAG: ATP-binding protein [Desulfobacterales bacterium]